MTRGSLRVMTPSPAADSTHDPRAPRSGDGGSFVGSAVWTALAAWRARIGVLTAAMVLLAVANAPTQWSQWAASARMEEASSRGEARGDRSPDPEEAVRDLEAIGPACCGVCGAAIFGFFVVMPLTAGATVLGARAVRGNARFGDLACGFRRYVPTLGAALVTLTVGGGAAMAVSLMNSIALIGSASHMLSSVLTPGAMLVLGIVVVAVTLWLTARLWFAIVRVADPERPRVSGMASVTLSWQWTEGPVQWSMLGVLFVAVGVALVAMLPGMMAWTSAASATGAARTAVFAIAVALMAIGIWLAGTFALVLFGAAYERVARIREPIAPPVHEEIATHSGGIDA